MRASPVVGVLGASGAVGGEATRLLAREGRVSLRLGARRVEPLRALAAEAVDGGVEVHQVDLQDATALARFCAGCRVVVNCIGPSFRILDWVARAGFAAGADYVDPGGDRPLYERLARTPPPDGRTALVTAGMMPGLSGILPRWLARQGFDRARRLTAYVGGRGRLTPGTAEDYVLSLGTPGGEAQAAWRGGGRVARALETLTDVELPFFPGRVTAYPFLASETETVARGLGLTDVSWYNVFQGRHLLETLRRVRPATAPDAVAAAAAELIRAAELDAFGDASYQLLVLTLEGDAAGEPARRTLVVRTGDAQRLTGTVTALATLALLDGEVQSGTHFAAEALPLSVVERLRGTPSVDGFEVLAAGEPAAAIEDGAL